MPRPRARVRRVAPELANASDRGRISNKHFEMSSSKCYVLTRSILTRSIFAADSLSLATRARWLDALPRPRGRGLCCRSLRELNISQASLTAMRCGKPLNPLNPPNSIIRYFNDPTS